MSDGNPKIIPTIAVTRPDKMTQIMMFRSGKIGENYNIGSNKNYNNLEICKALLKVAKKNIIIGKKVRIKFVKDRPGHDIRYALNSNKLIKTLKWKPKTNIHLLIDEMITEEMNILSNDQ